MTCSCWLGRIIQEVVVITDLAEVTPTMTKMKGTGIDKCSAEILNTKTQRHKELSWSQCQEKLCVFVSLCSVKIIPGYF